MYLDRIINVTATIISKIPKARSGVKGSPKTKTPTQTAVTGSVAPSTEVRVEPIWCTACTNVMLDTTVGKKANKTRLIKEGRSGMGWIPVPACAFMKNKEVLTINT